MRATGRVLGSGQLPEQPFHARRIERGVHFNGRVAGDRSRDPGARGLQILCLLRAARLFQHLDQHPLECQALETGGCGLDGDRPRPKKLHFKAIGLQFLGNGGERDHLRGKQVEQHRHEQPLALHLLRLALLQDSLEQYPLVGHVLVDDPQPLLVHCQDEGFAQLAQWPKRCQAMQGGADAGFALFLLRRRFGSRGTTRWTPVVTVRRHISRQVQPIRCRAEGKNPWNRNYRWRG